MDDEVRAWLARIDAATERLRATAAALSDEQVAQFSLCEGWTRGHVLTHISRNADGLANLLRWARTGTEVPMYASRAARDADIEAGARRPSAALATDVRESAATFAAEAGLLPDDAWTAPVRRLTGEPFPAHGVLPLRLSEVEIHHVDLAAGYGPGDWPEEFVTEALPRAAGSFAGREDAPVCLVWAEGWPHSFRIGPDQPAGPRVQVHGAPAGVLAWLIGRDSGAGLKVFGESHAPAMPPLG